MRWPWQRSENLRMEGGDKFAKQLATHLAAQFMGDGELPEGGLGGQRDRFIRFTPLARAVNIITALTAQMVCNGRLTVRNRKDKEVRNRRTNAVLELLSHSPDGGITPAQCFVEDVMADYLLDGNALVVPDMGPSMVPARLTRFRPHGAYTHQGDGPLVYQAMEAHSHNGTLHTIAARDMIHARWPLLQRGQLGQHQREHFAPAPVSLISEEFVTGIIQDAYVQKRFRKAPLAMLVASYDPEKQKIGSLTEEQQKEIREWLEETILNSPVLRMMGGTATELSASPVAAEVTAARSFQVETVARFYGLPLPLLSSPIGQWTRGVNEQVMRMAWRTGIRPHLDRLLAPFQCRLLLPGERFVADPSEFVRGDASGISEMLMAMQGDTQRDPVASREELRGIAGLPREPDGDIISTRKTETGQGNAENGPQPG